MSSSNRVPGSRSLKQNIESVPSVRLFHSLSTFKPPNDITVVKILQGTLRQNNA